MVYADNGYSAFDSWVAQQQQFSQLRVSWIKQVSDIDSICAISWNSVDAAGDELVTAWQGPSLSVSSDEFTLIYTPAGKLKPPVQQILHVIEPASCVQSGDHISVLPQHVLQATVYHCLCKS
jgi:hypothetical protein